MRALIYGKPESAVFRSLADMCGRAGIATRAFYPPLKSGGAMSADSYRRQFGDDIDFAAAGMALGIVRDSLNRRSFLELDSPFYGRLRKIACDAEEAIADFRPDVALVHNGFHPIAQILAAKSLRQKVAPLFWETPIIPGGAFILDSRAPYFAPQINSVDAEWTNKNSPADSELEKAESFINKWRRERGTKFPSKESESEVRRLNKFLRGNTNPLALFALQIPHDMNALLQLPAEFDGDYSRWAQEVLDAAPPYWKIIVKRHPRSWFMPKLCGANHFAADRINLHRLLECCDCAITLASNVGMEAALAGKPAIIGGRPFYSGKGITLELPRDSNYQESAPSLLAFAPTFFPLQNALNLFAARAILNYHFWPDDNPQKLLSLLARAKESPSNVGDIRRPFFNLWPNRFRRYANVVNELSALNLSRPTSASVTAHWIRRRLFFCGRSLKKIEGLIG